MLGSVATDLAHTETPFWKFATAVVVGGIAARGGTWLGKKAFAGDHPTTQDAAATTLSIAAFWLVAGMTWVALTHEPT